MKRFFADAILVLILVSIGSYISHKDDSSVQESVEQERVQFEEKIAQQQEITSKGTSVTLNDIEDNRAGKIAKESSEFVVNTIKGTVKTMSDIFEGILK